MVPRAVFSDALLGAEHRGSRPVALFIGLQPAFSVNRFIQRCDDRAGKHCGGEGSPYAGYAARETTIVLTSSLDDTANPMARMLTRARGTSAASPASSVRASMRSPRIVFDHNDVLDIETGEFVWSAIRCFASP